MSEKRDEILCHRCGRCCYRKIWIEDLLYYTPTPCQYLDVQTRLCTVYDRRHILNPECLGLEEGIRLGVFPADCPYVRDLPDYNPPIEEVLDPAALRLIEEGRIATPDQLRRYTRALRRG
ncbi:MAG: hypothetical protein AB1696_12040 [Planctomycetota bacterium]